MSRRKNSTSLAIWPGRAAENVSPAKFNENAPLSAAEEHALGLLFKAIELEVPGAAVARLRARRFTLPDGRGRGATGDLVQTSVERDSNRIRCVFAMLDGRALEYTLELSDDELAFFQLRPGRFSTAKH